MQLKLKVNHLKNIIYSLILISAAAFFVVENRQFFVEQYMRYQLRNSYIVVSLSTTPYRINNLLDSLRSLGAQNAPISRIYLSVPHFFARDKLPYFIPQQLANNKGLTILRTDDYGPATKLLGLLKTVTLPDDAIIITVDDDIIYPKNTILHLAYASLQSPNEAIGLSGADFYEDTQDMLPLDSGLGLRSRYNFSGRVTILQGYAGIAYRKKFFDESIFEIREFPSECVNSDDLYFSFYLDKNTIPRRSIANSYANTKKIPTESKLATGADALYRQIPRPPDKHRICRRYLRAKYPAINF